MPLAISYSRFSSGKQQFGHSLARQMETTRTYCAEQGLALDETVQDLGLSAFRGRHLDRDAGLGRLIERIRVGEIPQGSVLICEAHDRLSRLAPRLAMQLFLEIINAGVEVVTLIDRQRYSAATIDQNVGQLFVSIGMMLGSHMESRTKSDRVRAARQAARQAASEGLRLMTRTVPAWVDVVDGRVVANSGAATVRRIFEEVASGLGTYTVAKRLNAERVPTLSGSKKSNGWNKSRVLAIIRSDAPLGWFQPHIRDGERRKPIGEPIKNYYPAIVDQTIANAARQQIAGRRFGAEGAGRKGDVYSNLFTGIAKCGACGGSMFLSHRHLPKSKEGWLRCSRAVRQHECENVASVPYAALEKSVLESMNWAVGLREHVQSDPSADSKRALAEKKAEVEKIEKASVALIEHFAESPNRLVKDQIGRMGERVEKLAADISELERKIGSAVSSGVTIDAWKRILLGQAKSSDPAQKLKARAAIAAALRSNIERVECRPGRNVTIFLRPISSAHHRMQVHFGIDWYASDEARTQEHMNRMLPSVTVEAFGRREDVFLGGLAPALFVISVLNAEAEGKAIFDLIEPTTSDHPLELPPIGFQQQVVHQSKLLDRRKRPDSLGGQ